MGIVKQVLLGRPLPTEASKHERLGRPAAIAAFGLDALSSIAYAPQEILFVLVLAGATGMALTLPVAAAIVLLLAIVTLSYRQTIFAYPNGGGSYIVARENLGIRFGLVAAAALMIDYLLVVAVSVTAGVQELTSAFPVLYDYRVAIGVACIALMVLANLRGLRESGTLFAIPTYAFIATLGLLVVVGVARWALGTLPSAPPPPEAVEPLGLFLVLRAFAGGCTALTGVEAIANGVPVFRPPETRNAAGTLVTLAVILGVLFSGVAFLAAQTGAIPSEENSVISQLGEAVGGRGPLYFAVQFATTIILILAANTSFNGFPLLAAIMARDGYMPRQFANLGDRLVYANGIIILGLVAAGLVVAFQGSTHALIPLFAVGVFICFTLSQAGMARLWWTRRGRGWAQKLLVNGLGALTTGVATLVVASTKFAEGAWVVLLLLPMLIWLMYRVCEHYRSVADELLPDGGCLPPPVPVEHTIIVPVPGLNRAVAETVNHAMGMSKHVFAVHVTDDLDASARLEAEWRDWGSPVPLEIVYSPYRSIVGKLVEYVMAVDRQHPDCAVMVVLPEAIPRHWWEGILHNQTALRLKAALLFHPNVVVADVPYHLHGESWAYLAPEQEGTD
ncbi:MAG TPA: APC family permease [Chloroflexota bacterium]